MFPAALMTKKGQCIVGLVLFLYRLIKVLIVYHHIEVLSECMLIFKMYHQNIWLLCLDASLEKEPVMQPSE